MVTKKIPETVSCKYLGIILRSDLNSVDQVNYRAQKAGEAFHFVICVIKKGKQEHKKFSLNVIGTSSPSISVCVLGSCREGEIDALDRLQKAAQFTNHTKNYDWKPRLTVGR